ncbi:MAG: NYN domain-containing protein [Clostridia bacterium]|nr:NYN domain-containing protein [Clostridia bacterium]
MSNIALFIDIDNAKVNLPVFESILKALRKRGRLTFVKVYGFNERKHIKFGDIIEEYGFESAPTMRFKKRAKSQLDTRIFVDAVRLYYTAEHIDEYCFMAGAGDLVPLLSFLRSGGITLTTIKTPDVTGNDHMFDEAIEIDVEYNPPVRLSKVQMKKRLAAISKRSKALMKNDNDDEDALKEREELIDEIESLLTSKQDNMDAEEKEIYSALESLLDVLKI